MAWNDPLQKQPVVAQQNWKTNADMRAAYNQYAEKAVSESTAIGWFSAVDEFLRCYPNLLVTELTREDFYLYIDRFSTKCRRIFNGNQPYCKADEDITRCPLLLGDRPLSDCAGNTNQGVRRCAAAEIDGAVEKIAMRAFDLSIPGQTISATDDIIVQDLKYKDGSQTIFEDFLSGKGAFIDQQCITSGGEIDGKSCADTYYDQMEYIARGTAAPANSGDLRVPYLLADITGGDAWLFIDEA
jgi:hypothetical protein